MYHLEKIPRKPLVTVIIPVYNRARLVRKAIDSVMAQSEQDFELIVVDDHSDDGDALKELVNHYRDSRIQLIRHSRNLNGAAARNTGIFEARGRFIALLDSDDTWMPEKLRTCIEVHKDNTEVIYSSLRQNRLVLPDRPLSDSEPAGDYLIISRGCMQTSTLFLATDFAREVLFDDALKRFQDYDFVVRLEQAGAHFVFVEDVLVEMHSDDRLNRISSQTDCTPAIFWLNRTTGLSDQARAHFYLRRVVRLMAFGGDLNKVFDLMPRDVRRQLTPHQYCYLGLLRVLPARLIPFLRTSYQRIKYRRSS